MRVYIHTDLEGISAIDTIEAIQPGNEAYRHSIVRLMADVNAAVDGAFAGGATHVTVLDSHGGGGNFDVSLLDPRADLDKKENRKWWGKLDSSYDCTYFIGAHAMAGTINAFLDHTQSSVHWFDYRVNGRPTGELGQWAMVAAHFGVPLVMVSGDAAACEEARAFFTDVECAEVKRGQGRNRAVIVEPDEALARIREAARRAIALAGKAKPYAPSLPMEVTTTYTRSDYCDNAFAGRAGVTRLDARTLRKTAASYLELFI